MNFITILPYSAIDIACFFKREYNLSYREKPLEHLKLQKLIYIGYGWCWAILEKQLFKDRIEAWPHGPIIPSVHDKFKQLGDSEKALDKDVKEVLEVVYRDYIYVPSGTMARITHAPGTPWSSVFNCKDDKEIPKSSIHRYFELLYDAKRRCKIS